MPMRRKSSGVGLYPRRIRELQHLGHLCEINVRSLLFVFLQDHSFRSFVPRLKTQSEHFDFSADSLLPGYSHVLFEGFALQIK